MDKHDVVMMSVKVHFRSANDEASIKTRLEVGASGVLKVKDYHDISLGGSEVWWCRHETRYDDPNSQSKYNKKREHTVRVLIPSSVIQLLEVDSSW
ncbi:MAG: hypothetical protein JRN62_03460 [Nitrososphaerota archaeon]|nr:hypothetical protein [Nitrososphaerota archaeon]MDG6948657.1 hypothetical protein [Nitrososphaerota archaeon]